MQIIEGASTDSAASKGKLVRSMYRMLFEAYNSTRLLNFVKSDGILPVKFFPDSLLQDYHR